MIERLQSLTGSYWLRSGLINLFEKFSVLLFGFGSFFIIVRSVEENEWGVWALFLAVSSFIEMARNGLIQNALVKYLATSTKEDYPKIQTASIWLNLCISLIFIALLCVLAQPLATLWQSPQLKTMLLLYSFTVLALIPFSQFNFTMQARFQFSGIFWSTFFRQGLFFLYVVTCFLLAIPIELIHLVIVQILAALIGSLVSLWNAKKIICLLIWPQWQWIKELFQFGKYVLGTSISMVLHNTIDRMMLGALLGPTATARYDVALRMNSLLEVPISSAAAIVFPKSAESHHSEGRDATKELYENSVAVVLALLTPCIIFVLLMPSLIIFLIAGSQYLNSVALLQITILYGFFIPFHRQFGIILDSIGQPKINFYFVMAGAIINIAMNYLFINFFGTIGAAYGTLLTFFITFVASQLILNRLLGVQTFRIFKKMIAFYQRIPHLFRKVFSNIQ